MYEHLLGTIGSSDLVATQDGRLEGATKVGGDQPVGLLFVESDSGNNTHDRARLRDSLLGQRTVNQGRLLVVHEEVVRLRYEQIEDAERPPHVEGVEVTIPT